jgi:hypothetical protein
VDPGREIASRRLAQAYRAILVLAATTAGAAALAGWSLLRGHEGADGALFDESVRRAAIDELVTRGSGVWDTFPDATVARVLQPNLKGRAFDTFTVDSNDLGLRERPFELRKPDGTTRVVLLGDSYVMGYGVAADERVGTWLQRLLQAHAHGAKGPIECLHFGVMTWNVVAECAFLRRQLSLVRPDLVVQVAVRNDVEDNPGARGMGSLSNFWPRWPERGDGLLFIEGPRFAFGTRENSWLHFALDGEGRARMEEGGRAIAELARKVEGAGGKYLLFDHCCGMLAESQRVYAAGLRAEQSLSFPTSISRDDRYRNSERDPHWNRAGHELAALYIYEAVRARGLLPGLTLDEVPEAKAAAARLLPEAQEEIDRPPSLKKLFERRRIEPELRFDKIDDDAAAQVTGGVVRGGLVSPYASLLLRCEGRHRLWVAGRGLGRGEIDGVHVTVSVDEAAVGTLTIAAGGRFETPFDLPDAIAGRPFVAVRFQADDFCYAPPDLRHDIVFALERVALVER